MAEQVEVVYEPRGGVLELFKSRDPQILIAGPARSGKSRGAIEKLHLALMKYPGAKALMARKIEAALKPAALQDYIEHVAKAELDSGNITRYGGGPMEPAHFRYWNEAKLYWTGLSKASGETSMPKFMSQEYDIIYVQQAEEASQDEYETLITRLSNGVMPYQQIICDVNPQQPRHWLKLRADRGLMKMINSTHHDNPRLYTADGQLTEFGDTYINGVLGSLTGVRRKRLLEGVWAVAQGAVYSDWDPDVHVIPTFDLRSARKLIGGIDFGHRDPGVYLAWAIDKDDNMILVDEIFQTKRNIPWWRQAIQSSRETHLTSVIYADPSNPAAIEELQDAGLPVVKAQNSIPVGISAMMERLRIRSDGRPRLYVCQDARKEIDVDLQSASKPTCLIDEMEAYSWRQDKEGRPIKEEPEDKDNHSLDAARYCAMALRGSHHTPFEYYLSEEEAAKARKEANDVEELPSFGVNPDEVWDGFL
jgi:phage terminase large subunit